MGKLHELLAAETDVKSVAQAALSLAASAFKSREKKYLGYRKSYRPLNEEGETFPNEDQEIAATVSDSLAQVQKEFGRWMDLAIEKEVTNQSTMAALDLTRDGDAQDALLFHLPATALLNMEGKLAKLRDVYAAIPTNDPTRKWEWNEASARYETPPTINFRTEKVPEAIVGYQATAEHPAQIEWFSKDIRIGEWTQVLYSSMIPPNEKRLLLNRIDNLIIIVKQARQRANAAEVVPTKIARDLFAYIHQDTD